MSPLTARPSSARSARRPAARRRGAALALAVLGVALAPSAASATTGPEAAAFLSAQRVANGLPPLQHSASRSDGCEKHNNYMAVNGGGLVHGEQEGKPGYTPEGANLAGAEVLSRGGGPWDATWGSPWADAPLHLLLMFVPSFTSAGWAESQGFQCMRIGEFGSAPNPTYSVPGNGATGVPTTIDARGEGPYSPADVVGVDDSASGYNVLVYRPGAQALEIASATLVPAGGAPVAVRTIDDRTTVPGGGLWTWPGGVVVPEKPLAPATAYALDVTFTDGLKHHADFTTAGAAAGGGGGAGGGGTGGGSGTTTKRGTFALKVGTARRTGTKRRLTLTASGASLGRTATVRRERRARICVRKRCTVTWKPAGKIRTITLKASQTVVVPRPARRVTMRLNVSVDAATVGGVAYGARTVRRTYRR